MLLYNNKKDMKAQPVLYNYMIFLNWEKKFAILAAS